MKCSGIARRRKRQAEIEAQFGKPIEDILRDLYYGENLGIKQIAKRLGISDHVAWTWFDSLGIPRRDRSSAVALQWVDNPERREQNAELMKSLIDTGSINNSGPNNPAKHPETRAKISAAKMGAGNAMFNHFRELNPNWKGGKITYRGRGWHGTRTEAIRRDNGRCRSCGATECLQVHHITPYRETKDNNLDNLVTLCASCHMKVEHRNGEWR